MMFNITFAATFLLGHFSQHLLAMVVEMREGYRIYTEALRSLR